ncbi:MAG: GTPase ObgE [Candidatus Wolfebacteria bacterium]|nr:GTPase ObgE [Candidatus Wolfebacteria bacterium]
MILDEVKIHISGGDGKDGAVAFNKNLMELGPAGGAGGNGGSVYFEGTANLAALDQFRHKKDAKAQSGGIGRGQFRDGETGGDLVLKIPVGTVIHNLDTGETSEITKIGEQVLAAKGGRGGKGNFHFRSPTNTTPKEFGLGTPGESFNIRLELKLIADVGLMGLPNVGKSNLLNELTNAKSKVANYPFTTLEPNLGVYYDLILADIPGLIEGASTGKGLGIKFLRHIERTKTLFHLVAADSPSPVKDYKTVRQELKAHGGGLLDKKEFVFLSRSDNLSPADLKKKVALMNKAGIKVLPISILEEKSMEKVKKILNKITEEKISDGVSPLVKKTAKKQ